MRDHAVCSLKIALLAGTDTRPFRPEEGFTGEMLPHDSGKGKGKPVVMSYVLSRIVLAHASGTGRIQFLRGFETGLNPLRWGSTGTGLNGAKIMTPTDGCARDAANYGYLDGDMRPGSGHLRVTASAAKVANEFMQTRGSK